MQSIFSKWLLLYYLSEDRTCILIPVYVFLEQVVVTTFTIHLMSTILWKEVSSIH